VIKDFETVKKQLKELATVVNSFASEAVQLHVIEMVLGARDEEEVGPSPADEKVTRKKRAPKKKVALKEDGSTEKAKKKGTATKGAMVALRELAGTDFFGTPKTIGEIVKHCEVALVRRFKTSDISGKLTRLVRDGILKREKNADAIYEYRKT